jgi:hypothetical protein
MGEGETAPAVGVRGSCKFVVRLVLSPLPEINKNPLYFLAYLLLYFSDGHTKTG